MIARKVSATYKNRAIDESFAIAIKYGIGVEYTSGEFGMIHGPYDSVEECLDDMPEMRKKVFILELPSCKKLYRWHGDEWVEL